VSKKIFLFFWISFFFNSVSFATLDSISIQLVTGRGIVNFHVELAVTQKQRERGLMNRSFLSDNAGMLFVWDQEVIEEFWMKDTPISLDIVFLDQYKNIISIVPNTTPYSLVPIRCPTPFRYVLEVKGGRMGSLKAKPGNKILFDGV